MIPKFISQILTPIKLVLFFYFYKMKSSTVSQLQKELVSLEKKQIVEVCMRLVKYKKENKELLSYLLFDLSDEQKFVAETKKEITELFGLINTSTMYYARKGIRKVLRYTNKYIKYSGLHQTELELRIYFCQQLKSSGIPFHKSDAMINLYNGQIEKIKRVLEKLHEDIQFDFVKIIEGL